MSEGGLEDYLRTTVVCENWNKLVLKTRCRENKLIENNYISLSDLELLKYVCFMKNNSHTYSEILHVYNTYNKIMDDIENGNYK